MEDSIKISVIVPVFNGEDFIKRCMEVLKAQDFKDKWEIIFIDDASIDSTRKIIEEIELTNFKSYFLMKNSGQSAARNLGLSKAKGEYIYMIDVDDQLSKDSLSKLYTVAKKNNLDIVFSDFQRIEHSENQRKEKFNYSSDKFFDYNDITLAMFNELSDTSLGHLGLFGCNGRLIKRSILIKNKILFEEKLRLMEDKIFGWNVLSVCKNASYIREQLYSYYVYPEKNTALTDSLNFGFNLDTVKLIVMHVSECLKRRNISIDDLSKYRKQGLIYFTIHALITITRPMFIGKIKFNKGKKIRRQLIKEIIKDKEIAQAIKYYVPSKDESHLIPKTIKWKILFLIEFACNKRAKQTIKMRRIGKV